MPKDTFSESPWPPLRNAIITGLRQHKPHTAYGMGEIDVTDTLAALRKCQRETGTAASFHAFVISCIARAAAEHPHVHRYRFKNKFILFDDIDVTTVIERKVPNQGRIPVQHIFRAANAKTLADINWELRETSRRDPTLDPNVRMRRRVARFPGFVRSMVAWKIRRNPFWLKKFHGTIGVTNLQRQDFTIPYFGFPPNFFTMTIALGSITSRFLPDSQGNPVLRRVLCLAFGMDHAVVDGADVARFYETFTRLVSSGAGLDSSYIEAIRARRRESGK
jgi:pyruvate/2-oxoglutarate dehydrogenase complex dihydrolipoamide acyltransferase (E2) component